MGTQTDVRSYDDVMKLRQQTLVDLPGSKGGTWSSRLTQSTHRFIRSGVNRRNRDAIRRKISSSVLSIGRGAFLYPWLLGVALLLIVGLQLAQAAQAGSTVRVEQVYDADGQRVGKRVVTLDAETGAFRTNEQRFLLEGLNPTGYAQVAGVLSREPRQSWRVTQRSLHGTALIGTAARPADGVGGQGDGLRIQHVVADGHGNVRKEYSEEGEEGRSAIYTAWGEELSAVEGPSKSGAVRWGYAGEVWDSELGMYELRARQYRPEHGRFWTLDTFEGRPGQPLSLHKYLYCHGSPVDLVDPSGYLASTSEVGAATSIGTTLQTIGVSAVVSAYLTHAVYSGATGINNNYQIRKVAQDLGVEVEPAAYLHDLQNGVDWSSSARKREEGSEYFAHGTSTGGWTGSSILPSGGGDFGTGFYTFKADIEGLFASGGRATKTSVNRGGVPFILVVKIKQDDLGGTMRDALDLRGNSALWRSTVSGFLKSRGQGSSGRSIVIGPVSVQGRGLRPGATPKERSDLPSQWKWEDVSKLKPAAVVPVFDAFNRALAW